MILTVPLALLSTTVKLPKFPNPEFLPLPIPRYLILISLLYNQLETPVYIFEIPSLLFYLASSRMLWMMMLKAGLSDLLYLLINTYPQS